MLAAFLFFEPVEADPPPVKLLLENGNQIRSIGEGVRSRVQSIFELSSHLLVPFWLWSLDQWNIVLAVLLSHILSIISIRNTKG
jgi:hypothetical protein